MAVKRQIRKAKKKPRGKAFTKGGPGGPGRGHKKDPTENAVGKDLGADMRQAYTTVKTAGEPPGVTEARKLLKSDYGRFMALYAKLVPTNPSQEVASDATLSLPSGTEGPVAGEVGPKEERVKGLIEQLLKEWHEKSGTSGRRGDE